MNEKHFEILLIEDDQEDAELTQEAIATLTQPIHLAVVHDGDSALAYLNREGIYQKNRLPDLILLDLNLPGMSGTEILQAIRSDGALKHLPVVVLSTSDAEEDVFQSYHLGANCYLQKSLGMYEFQALMHVVTQFWLLTAKLPNKRR